MGAIKIRKGGLYVLIQDFLVLFQGKPIIGLGIDKLVGYFILPSRGLKSAGSMVTIQPSRAINSNRVGIAVIVETSFPLLFFSVFTGAKTNRFSVAQALTRG